MNSNAEWYEKVHKAATCVSIKIDADHVFKEKFVRSKPIVKIRQCFKFIAYIIFWILDVLIFACDYPQTLDHNLLRMWQSAELNQHIALPPVTLYTRIGENANRLSHSRDHI